MVILLAALTVAGMGSARAATEPLANWTRRDNGATNSRLTCVIYADGKFMVGGSEGTIAASIDGTTWTFAPQLAANFDVNGLAYDGHRYVAVGRFFGATSVASAWWSDNGTTWKQGSGLPIGWENLRSVAYGAGRFVAVGTAGVIASSTDGNAWSIAGSPVTEDFWAVAFAANKFVAVANSGQIVTSTDGIAWASHPAATTAFLEGVTYANGTWYAGNGFETWTSADAVTWTRSTLTPGLLAVSLSVTTHNRVLAAGSGRIYAFVDGASRWDTFTPEPMTTPNWFDIQFTAVAEGNGVYVATAWGRIYSAGQMNTPVIRRGPESQAPTIGQNVTLSVTALGGQSYQWLWNGALYPSATGSTFTLTNIQPTYSGLYQARVMGAVSSVPTDFAIIGLSTTAKVIGYGSEIAANIQHPNGNVFDQVLLQGPGVTFTADAALNQITRLSFVDLNNDIVQVEFSGAGAVSLVVDGGSGPAPPVNYDQPEARYIKGNAGIVVVGANETTNLSVFSVGRANAVNQALFRSDVTYDGVADIAFIAIASSNGKFGGLRTSNTSYFATHGVTGIYAPNVQFQGPVFVGDINAQSTATPYLMIGSSSDVRITGGDLLQANARAVVVAGITQLKFTAGATSHGTLLPAQTNKARLEENGVDVTSRIVVNP